jgi:phosphatidylserine/phosphatidylglycerophosphate/cardiolipin synthase-like enzyme
MDPEFRMPDGRGDLFAVLARAAERGLDVRVIFWRIDGGGVFDTKDVFVGNTAHRAMLGERGGKLRARWDRAQEAFCQHQKSWLIDAGQEREVAFVGGINLTPASVVAPGHGGRDHGHVHDIYLELAGPCATDVHHNFVQRWNEASERGADDGCWPNATHACDLPFPTRASSAAGDVLAQVQRTVRAGLYKDGTATPGGAAFAIEQGELSIFEQYGKAIAAARSYVYLENQALGQPETVEALHAALARGVDVTVLLPADAHPFFKQRRKQPESRPFMERLGALSEHERFTLVGVAAPDPAGSLRNIYVHAKAALIDDAWATIGSCNVAARSFFGDTELNVSFWSPDVVRRLRVELLHEHLGIDTAELDSRTAFARYRQVARENAARRTRGEGLHGLAFAIDPRSYGE